MVFRLETLMAYAYIVSGSVHFVKHSSVEVLFSSTGLEGCHNLAHLHHVPVHLLRFQWRTFRIVRFFLQTAQCCHAEAWNSVVHIALVPQKHGRFIQSGIETQLAVQGLTSFDGMLVVYLVTDLGKVRF